MVAILFIVIGYLIEEASQLKLFAKQMKQHLEPKYLETSPSIKVFFNVYANPDKSDLAKKYVKEQMAHMLSKHKVFIRSIGEKFNVENAIRIQHEDKGTELGTLKLLWDHCIITDDASEIVVYIHNKGSFHPRKENDLLRKWLTRAALSEECSNMPSFCDVCSFRMSPMPHPHTPGNMWAARCDYIRKLINPTEMAAKMAELYHNGRISDNAMIGSGRYAAEHWVHSHPSNNPCDLSTSNYVWNYNGLPEAEHRLELKPIPRYEKKKYMIMNNEKPMLTNDEKHRWFTLDHRLVEYKLLYNEIPPPSSYIWEFFNVTPPLDQTNFTFS